MTAFFIVLAVVTAGGIWATEKVDRPRRAQSRNEKPLRDQLATETR